MRAGHVGPHDHTARPLTSPGVRRPRPEKECLRLWTSLAGAGQDVGSPRADWDRNGVLDSFDVIAFLDTSGVVCP